VKSFEEIMREKQQKRAAQINTSNKDVESSTTTERKHTAAAVNNPKCLRKTKSVSPVKYKFTPIVFDLDNKTSERTNGGSMAEKVMQRSWENVISGSVRVQGRKRLSASKAAESASESSVALTDVSATPEQSASLQSDLTIELAPAVTESLSDKSEHRITPVIKRQSSLSSHTLTDGSKKRRTSVDSR